MLHETADRLQRISSVNDSDDVACVLIKSKFRTNSP